MKKITLGIGALSLMLISYSQDRCKRTDIYTRCENRVTSKGRLCDLHSGKFKKNKTMRDYSITRKEGEWYNAKVTDSYGNKYQNYFETASEANEWIYFVWSKEDWFNSVDSQELLFKAIENCKRLDKNIKVREI